MEQQPPQPISVPLDSGIDVSVDDRGQPKGVRGMINWSFDAEGAVTPRGSISRISDTTTFAAIDRVPGGLLPVADGLPASRPSYNMPLETEVVGKFATASRVVSVQSATFSGYTLGTILCHDQDNSDAVTGTVSQAYVQLNLYDATTHALLSSAKSVGWGDISDVHVTSAAQTGSIRYWLVTYIDPTNAVLRGRVISTDISASTQILTIGSAVSILTSVQTSFRSSGHAVEMNATNTRWLVFAWTSTLHVVDVDASGTPGTVVLDTATAFTTIHYEMASMRSPDDLYIWLASGSNSSTNIGVYSVLLSTQAVTRFSVSMGGVQFDRRVAVVARKHRPSDCILVYELPSGSISVGVDAIGVSPLSGVSAHSMGAVQGLALADAGSWVSENALYSDTDIRVGVIGLMSVEAQDNGFRSHVIARVSEEVGPSGSAVPVFYTSAILAHSDAGMYLRAPLARWSRISNTEIELPVMYVTRTTADRCLVDDAGTGYDVFDRAVRRTRITSQARQARGVVRLGPNTYIGGSVPMSWDGSYLTPAGFPLPPHSVKVTDNGVTAGAITAGTYSYRTRSVYQDAVGTLFDSPIVILDAEEITTVATHTPLLTIYPGMLWNETDIAQTNAPRFTIEVFRNPDTEESGDTTSRKAYSISHYESSARVTVVDKKSATDIATGELLPSLVDGELTSGPLPALKHLWSHRSRLWGIDAYDSELVRYTTEYAAPTAPRWNDALTARVSNSGQDCIGGASLADKVIVFQANQIAVMSGEGPDGTGRGSFSLPESLRGVGAMPGSQGSIVEMPTGVMFVHATGIYHLAFDLSLTFVGAKLTKKLGDLPNIVRGAYLPSKGEVWFLTDGTVSDSLGAVHVLVWDVTRSRWTTYYSSLGPFSDVLETDGEVYLQDTRGRLLEAHSASNGMVDHDELGTVISYPLSIKLPWLRIDSSHQMRLRKVHVGGSQSDMTATLTTSVTSYNESRGSSESNSHSYETDLTAYGRSFQVPARAVTERCTAAQCELSLVIDSPDSDSTFSLATLEYEVSVLPGTGKVSTDKKPTVTAV